MGISRRFNFNYTLHTDDGDILKSILRRLTQRNTFPNVIVRGHSIGGNDNLQELHNEGKLKPLLEEQGIKVRGNIS